MKLYLTLHSAIKWLKKDFAGACIKNKEVVLAFAGTIYIIWIARNRELFANKHMSSSEILNSIKTLVYNVVFSLYPNDGLLIQFMG